MFHYLCTKDTKNWGEIQFLCRNNSLIVVKLLHLIQNTGYLVNLSIGRAPSLDAVCWTEVFYLEKGEIVEVAITGQSKIGKNEP